MVFQCGHLTCCKCRFCFSYQDYNKSQQQPKWVMCPTCRQRTDYGNIAYVDDRQEKSSGSDNSPTSQDCEKGEASLAVQGSYGTKLEAVTRRVLWIKFSEPDSKVLVFSSWNDVLDVLEHAFKANGITYIRMKGGRKSHAAISEFRGQNKKNQESTDEQQEPKSIQVLLLLIQHGANGLNLLEAQHVVLVEPLLNPAAEAQAISRVHRIGQEKRTLVHRFIVKNTVGNTKNQDQPILTLKDVECLFASSTPAAEDSEKKTEEDLRQLPPAVAAAIAAERRLMQNRLPASSPAL
ncbi:unnamed protein product [Linum tenue]|uniref:Helicase C-terminal domain-containing protein n=1 Tax=Linum tenue TaxID=586396 RepID=A0AAV0NFE8_9ROSI|nr:unnamed protein product [Linum tenue]CAI0552264.1 unnamed protein product [Linum tenue]